MCAVIVGVFISTTVREQSEVTERIRQRLHASVCLGGSCHLSFSACVSNRRSVSFQLILLHLKQRARRRSEV